MVTRHGISSIGHYRQYNRHQRQCCNAVVVNGRPIRNRCNRLPNAAQLTPINLQDAFYEAAIKV